MVHIPVRVEREIDKIDFICAAEGESFNPVLLSGAYHRAADWDVLNQLDIGYAYRIGTGKVLNPGSGATICSLKLDEDRATVPYRPFPARLVKLNVRLFVKL